MCSSSRGGGRMFPAARNDNLRGTKEVEARLTIRVRLQEGRWQASNTLTSWTMRRREHFRRTEIVPLVVAAHNR